MSDSVSCLKTKCFVSLAVLVLGLGIGGAMTQFTVVNAIVLRGFSFPHPEQLVSVGLIDPKASDQNNNFGVGNIPAAQDYEDIKAAQKSFAMMAGYLNGSTINVTYKNNPQRYTGAYVTEDIFKDHRRVAGDLDAISPPKTTSRAHRKRRFSATKSGVAISMPTRISSARMSRLTAKPPRSSA